MMLDVNIAFLVAACAVMFGIAYTVGLFLDRKIEQINDARTSKALDEISEMKEVMSA